MAKTRKREKKLKVKTTTACKYDYKGEKQNVLKYCCFEKSVLRYINDQLP